MANIIVYTYNEQKKKKKNETLVSTKVLLSCLNRGY